MSNFFICPDCERPLATAPDSCCPACTQRCVDKLCEMDTEYQAWRDREATRRMTPGRRFDELLADMVKATGKGGGNG